MKTYNSYTISGKQFVSYIPSQELSEINTSLAENISFCYKKCNKPPILIGVLNGSFMFLSDLVKKIDFFCEIHFIKVSSYIGTKSSGNIKEIIGLNVDIKDRDVLIVEDIIDTGLTIKKLISQINDLNPKSLRVCTLLFKKVNCKVELNIDFIGKTIENKFVVGYGLDYNNMGRNLDGIYKLYEGDEDENNEEEEDDEEEEEVNKLESESEGEESG